MTPWLAKTANGYAAFTSAAGALRHVLLLVMRLYWGSQTAISGWNKLNNISGTADFFQSLGIPLPEASAVVSGLAECLGGSLLVVGLGARFVAPVLIVNFVVAYVTAHTEQAWALFSNVQEFVSAPPFLYLLTNILVLIFGAGLFSLDALIARWAHRGDARPAAAAGSPVVAPHETYSDGITRRTVIGLSVAAVGGLIAGASLASLAERSKKQVADGSNGKKQSKPDEKSAGSRATSTECLKNKQPSQIAQIQELDKAAPDGIQPSLLLEEPHVCCGLNTCKGNSKSGENACAGQGACATAETHVCQGLNECKAQGGCGEYPGQNTCKGKGSCSVPLEQKQWDIARERFKKLASLAGCELGPLHDDCSKYTS